MSSNVISLLKELIATDSRNPFRSQHNADGSWTVEGNENEIADRIAGIAQQAGFSVTRQPVHTDSKGCIHENILAQKGKGERSLLFYAHMDTVTSNPWLSEQQALTPATGTVSINGEKKDCITGLGSNDMKAGIAVMLSAFSSFNPSGFKLKLAFGVDEEFYSLGANRLIESDFINDVAAVIVPELGDGPNRCFGSSTVCLGRLGRCEFRIHVPGTGGHGAESMNPELVNSASECACIVTEIEKLRHELDDRFTFFSSEVPDPDAVSEIRGSLFVSRLEAGDGTLSVPCSGTITVDWTMTPNLTVEKGQAILREMINRMYEQGRLKKTVISGVFQPVTVELAPKPTPHNNAFLTPEDHPFVLFVKERVAETSGFMNFNMGYSVADENIISRACPGIPVLVLGPTGEGCHMNGEWVSADSVIMLERLYLGIAEAFGGYLAGSSRE